MISVGPSCRISCFFLRWLKSQSVRASGCAEIRSAPAKSEKSCVMAGNLTPWKTPRVWDIPLATRERRNGGKERTKRRKTAACGIRNFGLARISGAMQHSDVKRDALGGLTDRPILVGAASPSKGERYRTTGYTGAFYPQLKPMEGYFSLDRL